MEHLSIKSAKASDLRGKSKFFKTAKKRQDEDIPHKSFWRCCVPNFRGKPTIYTGKAPQSARDLNPLMLGLIDVMDTFTVKRESDVDTPAFAHLAERDASQISNYQDRSQLMGDLRERYDVFAAGDDEEVFFDDIVEWSIKDKIKNQAFDNLLKMMGSYNFKVKKKESDIFDR